MGEAIMEATAKAPLHLWVVGGASALWNAFGAFDYVMTQTRNAAYLASFTESMFEHLEAFPAWMDAAWACGVWGALLGSLLLLARSRYAVSAFVVSIAGLLVSTLYNFALTSPPPELMTVGRVSINLVIWAIAIGLLLYARRMRRRGVLR
jgi:hypothetical protein